MATSRLCVKNLPKYCDDARLRTLFSEKGEVTDVKVRRTRDGRSRQFAYVGFKRVEDAEAAQRFFDRSFIDTSRLRVEFAYAAKGESTPAHRPWSKYSKGSSAHERQEKAKAAAAAASAAEEPAAANGHGKHAEGMKGAGRGKSHAEAGRKVQGGREDEPEELREFLQVMQPRSKGKLWTNDDAAQSAAARRSAAGASVAKVREALERGGDSSASDEDDELYQDLPGGGGPAAADDSEEEEEEEEEGAGKDPMVVDASVSDMEYLRSRMTADLDAFDDDDEFQQQVAAVYEEEEEEEEGDAIVDASKEVEEEAGEEEEEEGDDGDEERWRSKAEAEASDQPHETSGEGEGGAEGGAEVGGSGRLFVRNLPFTTTEAEVHDLFEQHGDVTDVHLVLDKLSKKGRGIGYVRFTEPQQAQQALEALDSTIFQGRLLHVLPAQDIPSAAAAAGAGVQAGEGGSFKQQREAERKRSAGNREAWNTMFMRQDTVAEAVAAHFGVAKRELLDPTSSDQAVRMALGETQVISKTKDCLLAAGVDVATLEAAAAASGKAAKTAGVARSATTLLVKNLPWGVTETELREMFSKCGALGRVVLPSTGTLALVEFLEPPDARQAFRSVAYKRMHHVPLYLEWAPKAVFSSAAPRPSERAAADAAAAMPEHASGSSGGVSAARGSSALLAGLVDSELEDEDAASLSIYVKNLNFATGDASLRAKVAVKPGLKGKKALSMGYGFVECSSSSVAKALVKQLQGSLLDGHKLVLQLASAPRRADAGRAADAAAGGKMKASAKVLVRNLAFEATRKDLLGLFSPFGHVKSCRLPKKFDGSHRGFAFLEFGTKLEAKDAMQAAGSVHLYGRRLVLEYAKDEEGLDELRAKTAAKYRGKDGLAPPAKKART